MRSPLSLAALALAGWVMCLATPATAEKRVALVIGNGAYRHTAPLPNPRNDATDVAAVLKRLDFETIFETDLDKAGMDEVVIRFARAARDADVALFYYAGHAMQFAGVNYLMPVDIQLTDEADIRRMARVDEIVADLQQARNLRILVLDSCRNNPLAEEFKRSVGSARAASVQRGLVRIESPQGTIVSLATQAGRTADDGQGRNSPYTTAFLKHIETPEEIGTVFRRISADVYKATRRTQLPELSLSMIGEYFLRGRPAVGVPGDEMNPQALVAPAPLPIKPKAEQKNPFDGLWQLRRLSENCQDKNMRFAVSVTNGALSGVIIPVGKITGTVSPAGKIAFRHLGTTNARPDGKPVTYEGTLDDNSGRGTFYKGKGCHGTFTASRM